MPISRPSSRLRGGIFHVSTNPIGERHLCSILLRIKVSSQWESASSYTNQAVASHYLPHCPPRFKMESRNFCGRKGQLAKYLLRQTSLRGTSGRGRRFPMSAKCKFPPITGNTDDVDSPRCKHPIWRRRSLECAPSLAPAASVYCETCREPSSAKVTDSNLHDAEPMRPRRLRFIAPKQNLHTSPSLFSATVTFIQLACAPCPC